MGRPPLVVGWPTAAAKPAAPIEKKPRSKTNLCTARREPSVRAVGTRQFVLFFFFNKCFPTVGELMREHERAYFGCIDADCRIKHIVRIFAVDEISRLH